HSSNVEEAIGFCFSNINNPKLCSNNVEPALNNQIFLNSLSHPGVQDYCLILKPNTVCTLMRNISEKDGLMNNCKVIVQSIQNRT
ncbi:hypothetical protein BB558_002324, partial [Smittium angustum]